MKPVRRSVHRRKAFASPAKSCSARMRSPCQMLHGTALSITWARKSAAPCVWRAGGMRRNGAGSSTMGRGRGSYSIGAFVSLSTFHFSYSCTASFSTENRVRFLLLEKPRFLLVEKPRGRLPLDIFDHRTGGEIRETEAGYVRRVHEEGTPLLNNPMLTGDLQKPHSESHKLCRGWGYESTGRGRA